MDLCELLDPFLGHGHLVDGGSGVPVMAEEGRRQDGQETGISRDVGSGASVGSEGTRFSPRQT